MKRELTINVNNFIKSGLSLHLYTLLQVIFEKDQELFSKIIYRDNSLALQVLINSKLVKFTGGENIEDFTTDEFDILDFVLSPEAKSLFISDDKAEKLSKIKEWIGDYRNLFKGIKSGSMGDPNACLKKMMLFIKNNPQYDKDQIFAATQSYIKQTEPRYTMQADYFISKTGNDKIATSKLLSWLEQMDVGEVKDKTSINKMI